MPDTKAEIEAHWQAHAEPTPLPTWFNDKKHAAGTGGIVEIGTGVALDEDGKPVNAVIRAQRAQGRKPSTPPETPPATDTKD